MQKTIDKLLDLAKEHLLKTDDVIPTLLWLRDGFLLRSPQIMHSTNDPDHGTAEEDKKLHAYTAGMSAAYLNANEIIMIWPCAGIKLILKDSNDMPPLDPTLNPETFPKSQRIDAIAAFGIHLPDGTETLSFIAYTGGPGTPNPITIIDNFKPDIIQCYVNLKEPILQGYFHTPHRVH